MATQEPILFCNVYPVVAAGAYVNIPGLNIQVDGLIRLPYGLSPIKYDSTCEGVHISIENINVLLTGVIPFLRLADCVVKIIKFAQAVPDALGPPPRPDKLASSVAALGDCLTLLLSFTLPLAMLDFCKLIRDIIRFALLVLWCIRQSLMIKLESDNEATTLLGSADARLQDMGACLQTQNAALQTEINGKLSGVTLLLTAINILIGVTGIGSVVKTTPDGVTVAFIDSMIADLKASLNVFLAICP